MQIHYSESCLGGTAAAEAMICYADSSALIAWFHPADQFAIPVTRWVRENVTDFVWNPILRAEVRHNLRKLKTNYSRAAWNAYRASENMRRLVLGRETIAEILNAADDLSAEKAGEYSAGTWDFVHVAAFLASKAHYFATIDKMQAELVADLVPRRRIKLFSD